MTDIAIQWNVSHGDIAVGDADLVTDDGLETAVLLSLFLDRRADADDGVSIDDDPRGWWGDSFADDQGDQVGSKFWLLSREKTVPQLLVRVREYAEQALAWLVDDGVASSVVAQAELIAQGVVGLSVAITRPNQPPFNRQYQYVWSAV
ncbi:phage GP46 family protein [Dyella lutea]|uniref:Phage GP46 family protein n=1 Tax=Dyella lutea TaxID=2950441 RepID=A0ABT1FDI4_9GAMM|nr:phage GP46 family protein [Dyella lutea]MCP1375399.1 phage GP46 family protein [Dyella lutea]